MKLGRYNRGGYPAYELLDVPDREDIKIHRANRATELLGCIALGNKLGSIHKATDPPAWAVLNSKATLDEFMAAMDGDEYAVISIRWAI